MRAILVVGLVLVGCSGDGNVTIDARPRDSSAPDTPVPDAMVDAGRPLDAPPTDPGRPCAVAPSLGALTLGSATSPLVGNHFSTSSPPRFSLTARLVSDGGPLPDAVTLIVYEPTNGFATNVAYPNQIDPNATTAAAIGSVLGDYDTNAGTIGTFYWATSGATTFTAIGKTTGSQITGSTSYMLLQEIDQDTGAFIAGGCSTTISSLTFYLQQN